jgi:hypothetical protein
MRTEPLTEEPPPCLDCPIADASSPGKRWRRTKLCSRRWRTAVATTVTGFASSSVAELNRQVHAASFFAQPEGGRRGHADVCDARMNDRRAALQPRPATATVRSPALLFFGRSWCVGFLSTDEEEGFHSSFTLDGDRTPRFELELFAERLANGSAGVDPTGFAV